MIKRTAAQLSPLCVLSHKGETAGKSLLSGRLKGELHRCIFHQRMGSGGFDSDIAACLGLSAK